MSEKQAQQRTSEDAIKKLAAEKNGAESDNRGISLPLFY